MRCITHPFVVKSFLHRGLKDLFETGRSAKARPDLIERCCDRLKVLHAARNLNELAIPGFDCHPLRGTKPRRHAIKVSGPWRITFEWRNGNVLRVDLEQYH